MFTRRTIIGIIVGAAIIGIGAAALVASIGTQTLNIEETIEVGESLPYNINGPDGSSQHMYITGEKFDLELSSPADGLQIPLNSYKDELTLDWTHMASGITDIRIQNTGSTVLDVRATLNVATDPILFAYHFVVITAGVIIIGFSLGFSVRKPRGF